MAPYREKDRLYLADFFKCPGCGSPDFLEVEPGRTRCKYCGQSATAPQATLDHSEPVGEPKKTITCYQCGAGNEAGSLYCNRCGSQLTGLRTFLGRLRGNPAAVSMLVSVLGVFFFPPLGAVVGLAMAYRARGMARRGKCGDEKLARLAVLIGWGGLAFSVVPLCLIAAWSGAQMGLRLFENFVRELLSILGQLG